MPLPRPSSWLNGDEALGVVVIDLRAALACLWECRTDNSGYRAALERFLCDRIAGKRWLYHPREGRIREKLTERLQAQLTSRMGAVPTPAGVPVGAVAADDFNRMTLSPIVSSSVVSWRPEGADPTRLVSEIKSFSRIVETVDWAQLAEQAKVARSAGVSVEVAINDLAVRWDQSERNVYSFLHRSRLIQDV